MKLIDKYALVAEINKRIMSAPINNIGAQRVWAYNDVKDIIRTLEVKEVDLDFTKEPVSEELKEFEREYIEREKDNIVCVYDRHAGLVDGAKWQKEQMMKDATEAYIRRNRYTKQNVLNGFKEKRKNT